MKQKYILTGSIVLIAILLVLYKNWSRINNPWTRDGKVRATIIQIAPRVTGPIVKLYLEDNQLVQKGDLMFEIDDRTYQAAYDQAKAQLDQTGGNVTGMENQIEGLEANVRSARASVRQANSNLQQAESNLRTQKEEYDRQVAMLERNATSKKAMQQSQLNYEIAEQKKVMALEGQIQAQSALVRAQSQLDQAKAQLGDLGDQNPQMRSAMAAFEQAELNLEFTKVYAPTDGYITNLNLLEGSHVVANQPVLALVDINSYWVEGYFKETSLEGISAGNKASITLMSDTGNPLEGYVESIGWGISQQDGSTGVNLLPNVSPTFEWIRLAQRIPVKIRLTNPQAVNLRVGTTASVLVEKGTKHEIATP